MADLDLNSRYLFIDVVKHRGNETLGWWPGADWINEKPTSIIVATSRNSGRPDLIADEYLGDPNYWWALVYYNKATDLNWPKAGEEVQIPPRNFVFGS
jgi:hypothetical protein